MAQAMLEDNDDDFQYEAINEQDFENNNEEEDALGDIFATIQLKQKSIYSEATEVVTQVRPSVVDDFIRNFLIKANLTKSLEQFNTEWYELQSKGRLSSEISTVVPDIYLRNEELDQQTRNLREEVDKMREVSEKAQATWDRFRKERDFHRMHHKRVVQEKNKLINDIRMLKNHMKSYDPAIEEIKKRYELAMKEKSMMRLERDKLKNRVKALEDQIQTLQQPAATTDDKKSRTATRKVKQHASFPPDGFLVNPYSSIEVEPFNYNSYIKNNLFHETLKFEAHSNSISAISFHPKKAIFATASDDETWKLWTVPTADSNKDKDAMKGGELVMVGEGHSSWLSDLHFHPHGSHLVTSSGDGSLKIWELAQAKCSHTFSDHSQAVWGCEFHVGGDFIASCSMDHTIRIWDIIAGKLRQTLRGHVDSVNAVAWQPYTANVCSASGDKTLSMWDARTGLCVQTLYGHNNSCNHLKVTNRGDTVVSCDADGVVKVWDLRMVSEIGSIDVGPAAINKLALDQAGKTVIAASDDGKVKCINLQDMSIISSDLFEKIGRVPPPKVKAQQPPSSGRSKASTSGQSVTASEPVAPSSNSSPIQSVAFSMNDDMILSGGSDSVVKLYSLYK